MKFVIVTGLSGAGKTQTIQVMEDMGFYCIDNMPPKLIPNFVEICYQSKLTRVAVVTDLRGGEMFKDIYVTLKNLKASSYDFSIIFLTASNETLLKRYKETRRRHPLQTENVTVMEGIITHVVSFGFKYGIPMDADLVFDVRFLPNPFYVPELKEMTGNDKPVHDFVMKYKQSQTFLKMLCDMISYLLPYYIAEGKSQLVICIGCTGGKHRSVTIANELYKHLLDDEHNVFVRHRDSKN